MKLIELKTWINSLPDEFLEYNVVNGEEGKLDDEYWFRLDKPVISLMVDEENEEICILNEFVDDIDIDKNKIIS
jgi:hypothetical protein